MITLKPFQRKALDHCASHLAPALLGHFLVVKSGESWCGGMMVETEAYLPDDPASHAYRGRTERNQSMFGPSGYAYVYLSYGIHQCFNVVCGGEDVGAAVLVRGLEPIWDVEGMQARRALKSGSSEARLLTNGPGKLCQALGIHRGHDGMDLCDPGSEVQLWKNPDQEEAVAERGGVVIAKRIGISKAMELPLRFYLAKSPGVSVRK